MTQSEINKKARILNARFKFHISHILAEHSTEDPATDLTVLITSVSEILEMLGETVLGEENAVKFVVDTFRATADAWEKTSNDDTEDNNFEEYLDTLLSHTNNK